MLPPGGLPYLSLLCATQALACVMLFCWLWCVCCFACRLWCVCVGCDQDSALLISLAVPVTDVNNVLLASSTLPDRRNGAAVMIFLCGLCRCGLCELEMEESFATPPSELLCGLSCSLQHSWGTASPKIWQQRSCASLLQAAVTACAVPDHCPCEQRMRQLPYIRETI